jgi:hypothetical protein
MQDQSARVIKEVRLLFREKRGSVPAINPALLGCHSERGFRRFEKTHTPHFELER